MTPWQVVMTRGGWVDRWSTLMPITVNRWTEFFLSKEAAEFYTPGVVTVTLIVSRLRQTLQWNDRSGSALDNKDLQETCAITLSYCNLFSHVCFTQSVIYTWGFSGTGCQFKINNTKQYMCEHKRGAGCVQRVQTVSCPADRLQEPCHTECWRALDRKWMDGRLLRLSLNKLCSLLIYVLQHSSCAAKSL